MRGIQFTVAGLAFLALCWDAGNRLPEHYPSYLRCLGNPGRYEGRTVWLGASPVLESSETSFVMKPGGTPAVRIHSDLRPRVGDHVMVRGTFHRDGSITAAATSDCSSFPLQRAGIYVVSVAILLAFGYGFRKQFTWRDGALWPTS